MHEYKYITGGTAEELTANVAAFVNGPHPSTGWTYVTVHFVSATVAFVEYEMIAEAKTV